MKNAFFDENAGMLDVEGTLISKSVSFEDFKNFCFYKKSSLVYGKEGNAKYIYPEPLDIWSKQFRLAFLFMNGRLTSLTFLLVHGTAEDINEGEWHGEALQQEFGNLSMVLKDMLSLTPSEISFNRIAWKYGWGEIYVLWEIRTPEVGIWIEWDKD